MASASKVKRGQYNSIHIPFFPNLAFYTNRGRLFGSSAVSGSFVAGYVAEETRTRGFAAPAFAGCAFVGVNY